MNTNTTPHIRVQVVSSLKGLIKNNSRAGYEKVCARLTELLQCLSKGGDPVKRVTKETLEDFFFHNGRLVVAFDEDEKILGIGRLNISYHLNGKSSSIWDIFLDASVRRRGIGKNILLRLMDLAVSSEVSHIDLAIDEGRLEIFLLSAKIGFEKIPAHVLRFDMTAESWRP